MKQTTTAKTTATSRSGSKGCKGTPGQRAADDAGARESLHFLIAVAIFLAVWGAVIITALMRD